MNRRNRKNTFKEIEEVLGSKGRLRILKSLISTPLHDPALTVFRLRVLTGLKHNSVETHLQTLMKWQWVKEIRINGGRKYKLEKDRVPIKALTQFFKKTGCI